MSDQFRTYSSSELHNSIMKLRNCDQKMDALDQKSYSTKIIQSDGYRTNTDESGVTAPIEIEAHKFFEMLAVVPPSRWKSSPGAETFQLIKKISEPATLTLCRVGARYFRWFDVPGRPHVELIEKVSGLIEAETRPAIVFE